LRFGSTKPFVACNELRSEQETETSAYVAAYNQPLSTEATYSTTDAGDGSVIVVGRFAYRFYGSGLEFEDEFVMRYTISDARITAFPIFEDSLGLSRAYLGELVVAGAK
jgi:ketosteroid isomerase-like protein